MAEGMMLQVDGSPHDWLEGRGPQLCLIGAIDDAGGKVPGAFLLRPKVLATVLRDLQMSWPAAVDL
jgi:hypothetical protein